MTSHPKMNPSGFSVYCDRVSVFVPSFLLIIHFFRLDNQIRTITVIRTLIEDMETDIKVSWIMEIAHPLIFA